VVIVSFLHRCRAHLRPVALKHMTTGGHCFRSSSVIKKLPPFPEARGNLEAQTDGVNKN
tara:strand:+ start:449 stop:625 length:177 start_codon:yes stop_codon:yes gene_type:complete